MIQLNHVYKTFFKGKDTEVHALDDVTMTVKDGDFVTITGPSGSGKSTLMRVIEGMECADQGNCILNGIDLAKSSDKKRAEIRNQKMGIVLQDFVTSKPRTACCSTRKADIGKFIFWHLFTQQRVFLLQK